MAEEEVENKVDSAVAMLEAAPVEAERLVAGVKRVEMAAG